MNLLRLLWREYWPFLAGAGIGAVIGTVVALAFGRDADAIIVAGLGLDIIGIVVAGAAILTPGGWAVRPGMRDDHGPMAYTSPRDLMAGRIGIGMLLAGFVLQAIGQLSS